MLLCPGWEKVQAVYDLLEEIKVAPTLHPVIVLLGVGKDEAKAVRIPKNCERSTISVTKICCIRVLPSCCGDVIWSQNLHSSDQEVESLY